jgi:alanine racemase
MRAGVVSPEIMSTTSGAGNDEALGASGSVLTIDLDAIAHNYRRLQQELGGVDCAAVVKADAYGLGVPHVAPALARAGCRVFFVAHADEGVTLRRVLPEAEIFVFNGALPGAEAAFAEHRLAPVLNSLGAILAWATFCGGHGPLPAALHIDTGMSRLGLPQDELVRLTQEPERLAGIDLRYIISHLACAEERESPMNASQLAELEAALGRLPPARVSFANSSGIFLGPGYHFDLGRPGVALYGANPTPGCPSPMTHVVTLQSPIIQVREIDPPRTVGYGAAHRAEGHAIIATVPVGYADGYLRSASGRGRARIAGHEVPVVGRVSMDLITLDVTGLPPGLARPGAVVDLIDGDHPVDALAEEAGTIPYEILTSLGWRYARRYLNGDA